MRFRQSALAVVAVLAASSLSVAAKPKGVPPGHAKAGWVVESPAPPYAKTRAYGQKFSAADDAVVRGYFATKPPAWSSLPPGIAKNYARGKPLPPGIAKKALPADLLASLPPRPGYEYAGLGRDVVLIDTATRVVVDVIKDVLN